MAGTSGVNREVYAPFCGRLVVKFHRPTRPSVGNAAVVNVTVKRRDQTRHVWIRETNASEPLTTHRNVSIDDIKTGAHYPPGISVAVTCLLATRCPVYRWRDSNSGLGMVAPG